MAHNEIYSTTMRIAFLFLAMAIVLIMAESTATQRPPISDDALNMALRDRRYLMRQLKCALGEATCDPVGRRLKALAPLVLRGSCPNCSPQEHRQIQRVLSHVQQNFPREWAKIVKQNTGAF
ncbi:putative odorant-binding protein A10 [Hetaerina americana]|uniref:putative odorant-binding protein A10 n=1 Tax=Hetaerina americana TaxID=62018 RepID=UPI003A7F5EF3